MQRVTLTIDYSDSINRLVLITLLEAIEDFVCELDGVIQAELEDTANPSRDPED